jgi:hypothetical protein
MLVDLQNSTFTGLPIYAMPIVRTRMDLIRWACSDFTHVRRYRYKMNRAPTGIEPVASPTQTENHTTRPWGRQPLLGLEPRISSSVGWRLIQLGHRGTLFDNCFRVQSHSKDHWRNIRRYTWRVQIIHHHVHLW